MVDRLAARWQIGEAEEVCRSRTWRGPGLILAQPQTYMNRSGWAVECLVDLFAVEPERLLVAFDDIALPLGKLRLRPSGGPGGHRGLESVLASLQSDRVPRLRMGIAPEDGLEGIADLAEFVLSPFAADEREKADDLLARAVRSVETWRDEGISAAMNRTNG